MPDKQIKFIKYLHNNKERIWVKVTAFDNPFYVGKIYNTPLSKDIKFGSYVRVHKNKVISTMN